MQNFTQCEPGVIPLNNKGGMNYDQNITIIDSKKESIELEIES